MAKAKLTEFLVMKCAVDGCEKHVAQRVWCWAHYSRWRRHGDPLAGGTPKGALQKFIRDAISYTGDQCLLWPFQLHAQGYGSFSRARGDGRSTLPHRVVCEAVHGKPPTPEHVAAHGCANRLCVAPRHLRWATNAENEEDKYIHYAEARGWLPPGSFRRMRGLDSAAPEEVNDA
jgi:hypothetical protein